MGTLEEKKQAPQSHEGQIDDCMLGTVELDPESCRFYREAMSILGRANIPFLVGGAFALERYTGISRYTKDFDLFLKREDIDAALAAFKEAGYDGEMVSDVWLAKAYHKDLFVDMIFCSGNGLASVDDDWFTRAKESKVLGVSAKLCPAEEIIWQKAFVMERERYDGVDVAHLFRACAEDLDWRHLLDRFAQHWRVLYSYLVLFGFIYPAERNRIPAGLMRELSAKLQTELDEAPPKEHVVVGTLTTRTQFMKDVEDWGYIDGRLEPWGKLTERQVQSLNEEIKDPKPEEKGRAK